MNEVKKNESFFVTGSGQAMITGKNGKVAMMHLQDMTLELSSTMEDIFGGISNFALYSFQTEKGVTAKFTNASISADMLAMSQGVTPEDKAIVFDTEEVTVGDAGELTLAQTNIEKGSVEAFKADGSHVAVTESEGNYTVDGSLAGEKLVVMYRHEVDGVGVTVLTTSVPGYATIYHESNPLEQKDGRYLKIKTIIYKARCSGSLTIDQKQKEALAPELEFNAVDPERADKKFISFAIVDVTAEVKGKA